MQSNALMYLVTCVGIMFVSGNLGRVGWRLVWDKKMFLGLL